MRKYISCFRPAALVLAMTFSIAVFTPVWALPLDLEKQQELIQEQIEQVQTELNNKKQEESEALKELRQLNNTLSTTEKKLQNTQKNLSQTEKEIVYLENELARSEEKLNKNTTLLKDRVRNIYESGEVHFLEVLLSSASITDFLTRWDFLSRLAESDVTIIKENQQEIEHYQEQQKLYLVKKDTLSKLKSDLSSDQQKINIASSRQKEVLKVVQSEKSSIERALDDLEAESLRVAAEIRRITGQDSSSYLGVGKMQWPTPGYTRITSPFGWRIHPILKTRRYHTGLDIAANYGTKIVAAENGRVIFVGWSGGYGRVVILNHGGNISTMYAHASKTLVSAGDYVKKGDTVAKIGTTGWSTGPHLHFEVRKNGDPVNPLPYLK